MQHGPIPRRQVDVRGPRRRLYALASRAGVMAMGAELVFASLPGRMRASLVGEWRQAGPAQRFAYLAGGALILAGLAHLAAWLVVGGAWQGPVSFRKPATFGVSFGLTTITLAWITGRLQVFGRTRWLLLGPLAAADATEVAWVAVQRWRGVASHFNFATTLDTALFLVGGAAIAVTVTVIVAVTVLAFTRMQAAPSMAVAIRAGLVILLVAQGVGGWMIGHGVGPASDGVTQGLTTVGAAGVMKVPHAVAMHAIQVLPALAWLLVRRPARAAAGGPGVGRQRGVCGASGGQRGADRRRAGALRPRRGHCGPVPAGSGPARHRLRGRPAGPAPPGGLDLTSHRPGQGDLRAGALGSSARRGPQERDI